MHVYRRGTGLRKNSFPYIAHWIGTIPPAVHKITKIVLRGSGFYMGGCPPVCDRMSLVSRPRFDDECV